KPILYDFTAAWCGPCKVLDKDWSDPTIAKTVNAAFVPARVVDRQREDGKNPEDIDELQKRYEVSGFPTLVAAAPDGRLLVKLEGYRGRAALVAFLEEAKQKSLDAAPLLLPVRLLGIPSGPPRPRPVARREANEGRSLAELDPLPVVVPRAARLGAGLAAAAEGRVSARLDD